MDIPELRVTLDKICDWIPGVSLVTNLVNLFQKHVFIHHCMDSLDEALIDSYYNYIQKKSDEHCILAMLFSFVFSLVSWVQDKMKAAAEKKKETQEAQFKQDVVDFFDKITDETSVQEFVDFCKKHSTYRVRYQIEHHKQHILGVAAKKGNALLVEYILKKDSSSLNLVEEHGHTPLFQVCFHCKDPSTRLKIAKSLLDKGANNKILSTAPCENERSFKAEKDFSAFWIALNVARDRDLAAEFLKKDKNPWLAYPYGPNTNWRHMTPEDLSDDAKKIYSDAYEKAYPPLSPEAESILRYAEEAVRNNKKHYVIDQNQFGQFGQQEPQVLQNLF